MENNQQNETPLSLTSDAPKQETETTASSDPRLLRLQYDYVERYLKGASARKARLEDLMTRHGAKKWKPEKIAKMSRRLLNVTEEIKQANAALNELTTKLGL